MGYACALIVIGAAVLLWAPAPWYWPGYVVMFAGLLLFLNGLGDPPRIKRPGRFDEDPQRDNFWKD